MAFTEPVAGKPFAKDSNVVGGDVSAIIGVTGDAVGSLAISFSEECICNIAGKMLGETFPEANQEVFDAAGEITNMVSGVARSQLEKIGLKIFAAIPSIIYGKGHTFQHILKAPSIVVPFTTDKGDFIIDVCLQTVDASAKKDQFYGVLNVKTFDMAKSSAQAAPPDATPAASPSPASASPSEPEKQHSSNDVQNSQEKLQMRKEALKALSKKNEEMKKELLAKPFMPLERRNKLKKETALCDDKIRKLKLEIKTMEMLANIS